MSGISCPISSEVTKIQNNLSLQTITSHPMRPLPQPKQPRPMSTSLLTSTLLSMPLPANVNNQIMFEKATINQQFGKTSPTRDKDNGNTSDEYKYAFSKLNNSEMIELFQAQITILQDLEKNTYPSVPERPTNKVEVFVRGSALTKWKRKLVYIDFRRSVMYLEKESHVKSHVLSNYIYRRSKNTDYFSFALEAVNTKPKGKHRTIQLGFASESQFLKTFEQVKLAVHYGMALFYASEKGLPPPQRSHKGEMDQPENSPDSSPAWLLPSFGTPGKQKTVRNYLESMEDLQESRIVEEKVVQRNPGEGSEGDEESRLAILKRVLPDYDLQDLLQEQNMRTIEYDEHHRLLQDTLNTHHFKVFLTIPYTAEKVFSCMTNPEDFKRINREVEEFSIKNLIRGENTTVLYMNLRKQSALYRERDFLFLRHAFRKENTLYLVDKSIESPDYPPFMTIVRGEMRAVWGFVQNKEIEQTLLILDLTIDNEGMLTEEQNSSLALKYLRQFYATTSQLNQKVHNRQPFVLNIFRLNWELQPTITVVPRRVSFQKEQNISRVKNDDFDSMMIPKDVEEIILNRSRVASHVSRKEETLVSSRVRDKSQSMVMKNLSREKVDIEELSKAKTNLQTPDIDEAGMAIVRSNYLHVRHRMFPWPRAVFFDEDYNEHHIWKGEWKHDSEGGGLWYKDEVKMEAQKKILGFVVRKIGTNLLAGKSVLSISLPVQIFSTESNLERLARTFVYAPLVLEKVSNNESPLEQLKQVLIISLTHSLLYMSMEKPFNPVLGETFQGSINGCPIFLQQISHHPPIASFYMVGRGYKIYGSIESKMDISMNSGCGINDGDFVVEFENGTIIKFRTPGGEVSGLTFGDRKLNLLGKGFFWSPNKELMLEISYNPNKKGFFSVGKQTTPADYFIGTVKKVRKQFIQRFESSKTKTGPNAKQTLQEFSRVEGIWTREVIVDGKVLFNIEKQKYLKFEYEPNPLPSDANYRQDIIYRRLGDLTRCQTEKQRIEVKQRQDKKLRGAHGKHH